ncbi:MAG: polysaccharide biosynthesis C-terminal domain-containing protein [Bacteroidota bacterium]|nr:polysaccharide biosynthesis C-terminal domain-containing protein [Bacteroidota bacterium]
MKKKFLINLCLLVILNLLVKPFWVFGIECTVQNLTGSGEYGFYFSLLNFSLLFNIFLDLGITNFNNRSLAREPGLFKQYYFNIVIVRLLLAFLYGAVTLTAALLVGYEKRQLWMLLILVINQFLASFVLYLRSNLSGLQHYTTDSLMSVLDRGIMIAISSVILWGNVINQPFRIEWFAYIQLAGYSLAAVILALVVKFKTSGFSISFDSEYARKIIQQSLPYALLVFLMATYTRIDGVMLERLLPDGKVQAGIYAQSFRILDAASMFAFLFPTLLLPMFSRLLASKEDISSLVKLGFSLILIFSTALSFSCYGNSGSLIDLIYKHDNQYSAQVFSVLILVLIPISTTYIFGTLLTANGNLKQLNYMAVVAVVINIGLNLLLIPAYKAVGAAIASLTTQLLAAICQVVLSFKLVKVKISLGEITRYLGFIMISALATMFISLVAYPWEIHFIGTAFTVGLLSLITGILPVNKMVKMLRQAAWNTKN